MQVYILKALGFGDREDSFENVGVYSSEAAVLAAEQELKEEHSDMEVWTETETWVVND